MAEVAVGLVVAAVGAGVVVGVPLGATCTAALVLELAEADPGTVDPLLRECTVELTTKVTMAATKIPTIGRNQPAPGAGS